MATRGRSPSSCLDKCAVDTAMSASCSTVGSGMTPQSARNITPCSPKRVSSTSMIMQLEAVVACGATLMIWNSGRGVLDPAPVAQQDRHTQAQAIELPRRLQDARFRALGEHDSLGMALELFDDVANKSHGELSSGAEDKAQLAIHPPKSIDNPPPNRLVCRVPTPTP